MTLLPETTVSAYRTTVYRATYNRVAIDLRVGQPCPALDRVLDRHGWDQASFLTACNPLGIRSPAPLNDLAHARLTRIVTAFRYPFTEGVGASPDGSWPPEKSLLVFGMPRDIAAALAQWFFQNAFVHAPIGCPAELVLLR